MKGVLVVVCFGKIACVCVFYILVSGALLL